jgi:hypothetical protein
MKKYIKENYMLYKASLDKTAKFITIWISALFIFIGALQYVLTDATLSSVPSFASACLLIIYLLVFLFRPARYIITNNELIIVRGACDVRIKRSSINNVAAIEYNDIGGAVRTFGVGGLFGYYGKFANRSLGHMTWFVTRKDSLVLLKTADKTIVLSPDQREEFIKELLQNEAQQRYCN